MMMMMMMMIIIIIIIRYFNVLPPKPHGLYRQNKGTQNKYANKSKRKQVEHRQQ